ncbi:hypothetical protein [Shewanella donghaensis]|uniref:hypothetical protein n=1 Tax=Shewanella donghaensis TaxID=238836 RepID=UPI001183000C|nr:hypothetical protein [Shewanella donghaensis]
MEALVIFEDGRSGIKMLSEAQLTSVGNNRFSGYFAGTARDIEKGKAVVSLSSGVGEAPRL